MLMNTYRNNISGSFEVKDWLMSRARLTVVIRWSMYCIPTVLLRISLKHEVGQAERMEVAFSHEVMKNSVSISRKHS